MPVWIVAFGLGITGGLYLDTAASSSIETAADSSINFSSLHRLNSTPGYFSAYFPPQFLNLTRITYYADTCLVRRAKENKRCVAGQYRPRSREILAAVGSGGDPGLFAQEAYRRNLVHEHGHLFWYTRLSKTEKGYYLAVYARDGPITPYGNESVEEDFADAFAAVNYGILEDDSLHQVGNNSKERFEFINELLDRAPEFDIRNNTIERQMERRILALLAG